MRDIPSRHPDPIAIGFMLGSICKKDADPNIRDKYFLTF
jgi:hypothetical protein